MTEEERELRDLLMRMDSRLQRLETDSAAVRHVLIEGNGRPAMTVRMALAENELQRLNEERTDRKMPRAAWAAILISTVMSLIGVVLTVAMK